MKNIKENLRLLNNTNFNNAFVHVLVLMRLYRQFK